MHIAHAGPELYLEPCFRCYSPAVSAGGQLNRIDQLAVQVSVGAALVPLYVPWNPKLVLAPGAIVPL